MGALGSGNDQVYPSLVWSIFFFFFFFFRSLPRRFPWTGSYVWLSRESGREKDDPYVRFPWLSSTSVTLLFPLFRYACF